MPYNENDYTLPPYVGGVMTLTNEECLNAKERLKDVLEAFVPDRYTPYPDMIYMVSSFNQVTDYKEAINGDTYLILEQYNPEVNTQGINEHGIVPEPEVEGTEPEAPEKPESDEVTPEGETPTEEETTQDEEIQGA